MTASTQMATRDDRAVGTRKQTPEERAKSVASMMAKIQEQYLRPFRMWEAIGARVPTDAAETVMGNFLFYLQRPQPHQPWTEVQRQQQIARLEQALDDAPAVAAMREAYDRTQIALYGAEGMPFGKPPTNPAQNRLLIGVLIDSYPNARPHEPATYLEALVAELAAGEYPAMAVAKGCNMLVRSSTFVPSVAEVVQTVERVVTFLERVTYAYERHLDQRKVYEATIGWLREVPLYDQANPQPEPPIKVELDCDPFNPGRSASGRVSWV